VQFWDVEIIDSADRPSDVDNVFEMEPLATLRVGTDACIQVSRVMGYCHTTDPIP
jgi:hypothetical protein